MTRPTGRPMQAQYTALLESLARGEEHALPITPGNAAYTQQYVLRLCARKGLTVRTARIEGNTRLVVWPQK